MNSIYLYFRYIATSIKSQMQYKTSFWLMTTGNFFLQFIEFLGLYALFLRFETIGGYSLYQVAVYYGSVNIAFSLAEGIGRGYDMFHQYIRLGTLDRMLLRPRSVSFQVLAGEVQLMRLGRLFQGALVLSYGLWNLESPPSVRLYAMILAAIMGCFFVFMGLFVLQATLSIFTIQGLEVANAFTYGGVQMAQYPMSIYKKWFQRIFTYLIPLGFMSYGPLTIGLKGGQTSQGLLMPILGLVFLLVTYRVLGWGLRQYQSTGS